MRVKGSHFFSTIMVVAALTGLGSPTPAASQASGVPGSGSRTFSETGKVVRGLFLEYWDAHGGLAQQGYPISDEMHEVSETDGKSYAVQYFERAVFEYHPENQAEFRVLLSLLGVFYYDQKHRGNADSVSHPGQRPNTEPGSVPVPETGKRLGGIFLQYWRTHGGLAQQGYPISDEMDEVSDLDGKTYRVQYFQRAVFEHHSENAGTPYEVLLSQLGTFRHRAKYGGGPGPAQPAEGLVDVGGHKLYYRCSGQGSPTVVMDAGLGTTSSTWAPVEQDIARFSRVCVYDRAGLGKSERGPTPRTSRQVVTELHALLANAKISGPYVLVAHSHGGLNMQLYAATYKAEIAGLVMVDATPPGMEARYEAVLSPEQVNERKELIAQNREGLSYEDVQASDAQVVAAGPLPDVPLIVLRHGRTLQHPAGWPVAEVERVWREAQEDFATRTSKGKLVVAEASGHFIHIDQPELVLSAVHEVVEPTR
jgi:pimeloyl-ACP methyl ester carboxylesterase